MTREQRLKYLKNYRAHHRKKNPVAQFLAKIKYRARKSRTKYTLSKEWAKTAYTGRCSLTGIKFKLSSRITPFTPSVDKIDPKRGYTVSNCRFVLMGVNALKGNGTDEDMYKIAKALINRLDKSIKLVYKKQI